MTDTNTSKNIPPVFIINLAKDTERRRHMESICSSHKLKSKFVEAINSETLTKEEMRRVSPLEETKRRYGGQLSYGEIACAMSHMLVYKKMFEENIPVACILEDDVDFQHELTDILSMTDKFPKQWEIVFLGYHPGSGGFASIWYKHPLTDIISIVRPTNTVLGAHSYIINKKGARKLLHRLATITMPLDWYTGNDSYINIFLLSKHVVLRNPHLSQLSSISAMGRLPYKAPRNTFFRRLKNYCLKRLVSTLPLKKYT